MMRNKPIVAVVMGSPSDKGVMEGCVDQLHELAIPCEVKVLSAHRTPEQTREFAVEAAGRGIEVVIAGAGWAAHLAGFIAGLTDLPVIGVPIDSSPFQGLDALLATVQMPPGIPVATVAVGKGGARNAAVLAARILGLKHPDVAESLSKFSRDLTRKAAEQTDSWEK